jgi:hypothetical protein
MRMGIIESGYDGASLHVFYGVGLVLRLQLGRGTGSDDLSIAYRYGFAYRKQGVNGIDACIDQKAVDVGG